MRQNFQWSPEMAHLGCATFVKSTDGIYIWASEIMLARQRDILGKKDSGLPWVEYAQSLREHDQEVLDCRKPTVFKESVVRASQRLNGVCHKSPLYNEKGDLIGVSGIFLPIPVKKNSLFSNISVREKQCLGNLAQGLTAAESSRKLRLSRRTVEGYLDQLRLKFRCRNQSELLALYLEDQFDP